MTEHTTRPLKKKRPSQYRRRIRELECNAAQRTLNGNGMNGSLPPLPQVTNEDKNDGDCGGGYFSTLFGHPYGALPYGNIHLATPPPSKSADESSATPQHWHPDIVRHSGLGQLCQLNDEQLLNTLSYVDGPTLSNGIICTSRFLYVAGHHEELWRDLVLRRWGESGFTVPSFTTNENDSKKKGNNNNSGCWKDIYACNHYHSHDKTSKSTSSPPPILRHDPLSMKGIYSDTFFRSWLCRSFALQPSWLSTHTVPTLPIEEVTTTRFIKEYEEKNQPLLIKGASKSWPAMGGGTNNGKNKWTTDYLLKVTQGQQFRATSGAAPLPASFTLQNYLNYCSLSTEEAPLYLFDRTFATKCPALLSDFDSWMKESCSWWSRGNEESGHDLFSVLDDTAIDGEGRRPDFQWFIVGPKRSGSCFHIDPNCTHAWNAPIIGRKRWIFYPPGVTPPGVFPSADGEDVCMPISIGEWFLTYFDEHVKRRSDPDISRRPLECTAEPGDVLFVPHGWWHLVLNIGDDQDLSSDDRGVSVALTRNYVSASNLPDVLRFLDTRVSQISGCRDRKKAVPPEDLGREFRKGLIAVPIVEEESSRDGGEEKKCDDAPLAKERGKWTDLLERAEKQSKKGWGCNAWVDLPSESVANSTSCEVNERSSILAKAKQQQESTTVPANGGFSFSFL